MPTGQAQTTWYPELKGILKGRRDLKMSIEQDFDIVNDLKNKSNSNGFEYTSTNDVMSARSRNIHMELSS